MSRLKKISANKKKKLLLISISLVIIGFIPQLTIRTIRDVNNPYTVEPLALESEDGTYISSFLYTPKGEKSHGGIVVSHRFWGDKKIMEPLSIELVRRGFTVISIDFRGHGASGGQFVWSELVNDMKAAVDYLEYELPYITQIGLIGHSLGATIAAELAKAYPNRINATVAIGSLSFNPTGISNLLMAIGSYEPFLIKDKLLDALRSYTNEQNVSIGQLYYGDFVSGNNTMAFVGENFNHLLEIIDPSIMYQTVLWFEQAFNGAPADDIILTEWFLEFFILISQIGAIMLTFVLIILLSDNLFKSKIDNLVKEEYKSARDGRNLISYFALLIMGFAVIFFNFLLSIPRDTQQLNTTYSILFISTGAAIGVFILYLFLLMSANGNFSFKTDFLQIKKMSASYSKRSVVFGVVSALLLLLSLSIFWNITNQSILFVAGDFGILISLIIISFPVFLIKEFYFRTIQERLKKSKIYIEYIKMVFAGILMDNLIISIIFSAGWFNTFYMPVSIPSLSVWIKFSIIQQILVTFIYLYSGRNIIGSTLFSSIIFAWFAVIIFPSYGFL